MPDDKVQPNANDRPEQAKSEQAGQQTLPSHASATVPPNQPMASRRRPILHLRDHAAETDHR